MTVTTPSSGEILLSRQRAFLLHQLTTAPTGTLSKSEANAAIPKLVKAELGLTAAVANDLRAKMATLTWVQEENSGRNVSYSVTEIGLHHAHELERYIPLLPAKGTVNPPSDPAVHVAREVYVLDALSRAAARTISKTDLDAGFGGRPKLKVAELAAKHPDAVPFRDQHCLGLNPATTRAVLTELALRDDVSVSRAADSEAYLLTPSGAERLGRLRSECPVLPPTGRPTPAANDAVRRGREAFLLLTLLAPPKPAASGSKAKGVSYPKPLKLNHATAWQVRGELAKHGHIAIHWSGTEGRYALTPPGKRYLATLSFDALGEVKIAGSALTELLAVAREGAKPIAGFAQPPPPSAVGPALTAEQLERAVTGTFHELLRGPFANLRMVPIHEIRRRVVEQYGTHAVSHAAFNDLLLELRRTDKLRLVSIDDRSRATTDQLRDSVFAVGETFFYAEQAHAHDPSG